MLVGGDNGVELVLNAYLFRTHNESFVVCWWVQLAQYKNVIKKFPIHWTFDSRIEEEEKAI